MILHPDTSVGSLIFTLYCSVNNKKPNTSQCFEQGNDGVSVLPILICHHIMNKHVYIITNTNHNKLLSGTKLNEILHTTS